MKHFTQNYHRVPDRRWGVRLATAALLVVVGAGVGSAQTIREVVKLDSSEFEEKGELVFEVEFTDDEGRPISPEAIDATELGGKAVELLANDVSVGFASDVQAYGDTGKELAVAIVMGAHYDYQYKEDSEPSAFDMGIAGIGRFVQSMADKAYVGVWCYQEGDDWQEGKALGKVGKSSAAEYEDRVAAACRIDSAAGGAEAQEGGRESAAPLLYQTLEELLALDSGPIDKAFLDSGAERKIIIIMSDGLGVGVESDKDSVRLSLERIAEELPREHPVFAICYDTIDGAYCNHVDTISKRSNQGRFVNVKSIDVYEPSQMAAEWKRVADILLGRLVIRIKTDEFNGQAEGDLVFKLRFQINGTAQEISFTPDAPLPERGTEWLELAKTIGIYVGGGLLGLMLFILILRRIQNPRPKNIIVQDEGGPEYTGPARGRLLVTRGPLAGETYYLTEEVTTIGRMEGNHILIDDPSVSKRHAGIRVKDLRFELADLGAANGVLVNGRTITKQFLRDGDEIRVGDTEMTFSLK